MIEIVERLISRNVSFINEEDDYMNLRRLIANKSADHFVVVLGKKSKCPTKVATVAQINQIERSPINSLEMFSRKLSDAYCVDNNSSPEFLLVYIAKIESVLNFPGIILLQENVVDAILPGKALYSLLSHFEQKLGIKGTRSPDPFGVISLLQLPDLICYRCSVCNSKTKTTVRENVPLCRTPWHGMMVLTPCDNSEGNNHGC